MLNQVNSQFVFENAHFLTWKVAKMEVRLKCDVIVDDILSKIVNGIWAPGDRVPSEPELCEQYAVSRVTVREGLKKLEMMDVVSIQQGRGTFVKGVDLGTFMQPMFNLIDFGDFDVRTIYDARLFIETGTCRLAAINRTVEDLAALDRLLQRMKEVHHASHAQASSALQSIDAQFHIQVALASKNEILKAAVINLEAISAACARRIHKQQTVLQDVCEDHARILEAIRAKDPDAAEKAIVQHTLRSEDVLDDSH
jgi:GntR family transcriptional repressor for pyruvate dehydrogenase complex